MPNPAWGGQGVIRNTTGSAVSYEMGVKVQTAKRKNAARKLINLYDCARNV